MRPSQDQIHQRYGFAPNHVSKKWMIGSAGRSPRRQPDHNGLQSPKRKGPALGRPLYLLVRKQLVDRASVSAFVRLALPKTISRLKW